MLRSPKYRDLVALFPRYLTCRRRKWTGLQNMLQSSRLERPAFFLLMALVQETDPGDALSQQELESRLFNPYATYYPFVEHIPLLQENGYLNRDADGRYVVTQEGRILIIHTEQAAREYMATLTLLPLPALTRLAASFEEIAQRMWQADEPAVKAHQARCQRLPPVTTVSPPMVHLERAIFALWMARDDAHIAAWHARGLSGPQMDLLSRLWTGEAQMMSELSASLQQSQLPKDIAQGVTVLNQAGDLHSEGECIILTEAGRQLREGIEQETDRLYFAPWPTFAPEELNWMYSSLETVCKTLATEEGKANAR